MALITISIQDSDEGPQLAVLSEPPLPRTVLDGAPSPAQAAAAVMLNALTSAVKSQQSGIIVPPGVNGH